MPLAIVPSEREETRLRQTSPVPFNRALYGNPMSEISSTVFARQEATAHEWVEDIASEMDASDSQVAYHALRGVLFALRGHLRIEESHQFSAYLPMLVRGLFFEGYTVIDTPLEYHRGKFLEQVGKELEQAGGADPETATRAVLKVVHHYLGEEEAETVRTFLPDDLQGLWPERVSVRTQRVAARLAQNHP